jgi:hypothetical protein
MSAHLFTSLPTPIAGLLRWKCRRCGVRRRRVVDAGGTVGSHTFARRSFWLYQHGGGAWTNSFPGCTGLRA